MEPDRVLSVRDLTIAFPADLGGVSAAVEGLSLEVAFGERVALVGESGSGKSVTALACLGLVQPPGVRSGGTVVTAGVDVFTAGGEELRAVRGGAVGMVFQEASGALNPVYTVGFQVAETLRAHDYLSRPEARMAARRLLDAVVLEDGVERAYPHQLSGGQAQRVMIALALAGKPRLLIADEPTSALDLITQAEILDLLETLTGGGRASLLLISHDLGVVSGLADRVVVMYAGRVVEEGPVREILDDPLHPYTRMLLAATRRLRGNGASERRADRPPVVRPAAAGCRFAPRCPLAADGCSVSEPDLLAAGGGRRCRCPVTLGALDG